MTEETDSTTTIGQLLGAVLVLAALELIGMAMALASVVRGK